SNGANVAAGMIASKTEILRRLHSGHYVLHAAEVDGVAAFLTISLDAEARYEAALAAQPGLLFEDHLEPMLAGQQPQYGPSHRGDFRLESPLLRTARPKGMPWRSLKAIGPQAHLEQGPAKCPR